MINTLAATIEVCGPEIDPFPAHQNDSYQLLAKSLLSGSQQTEDQVRDLDDHSLDVIIEIVIAKITGDSRVSSKDDLPRLRPNTPLRLLASVLVARIERQIEQAPTSAEEQFIYRRPEQSSAETYATFQRYIDERLFSVFASPIDMFLEHSGLTIAEAIAIGLIKPAELDDFSQALLVGWKSKDLTRFCRHQVKELRRKKVDSAFIDLVCSYLQSGDFSVQEIRDQGSVIRRQAAQSLQKRQISELANFIDLDPLRGYLYDLAYQKAIDGRHRSRKLQKHLQALSQLPLLDTETALTEFYADPVPDPFGHRFIMIIVDDLVDKALADAPPTRKLW